MGALVTPGVHLLFQYRCLEYSTGLSHDVGVAGSGPLRQPLSSTVVKRMLSNTNSWRSRCSSDQLIDSGDAHNDVNTHKKNWFPKEPIDLLLTISAEVPQLLRSAQSIR